jgi:hypothetical protein
MEKENYDAQYKKQWVKLEAIEEERKKAKAGLRRLEDIQIAAAHLERETLSFLSERSMRLSEKGKPNLLAHEYEIIREDHKRAKRAMQESEESLQQTLNSLNKQEQGWEAEHRELKRQKHEAEGEGKWD